MLAPIHFSLPCFVTPALKYDTANTNLNKGVIYKDRDGCRDTEFFDLTRLLAFTRTTELLTRDLSGC